VVLRHPFDSKGFAAKRVGQQALQGARLVVLAVLRRLHDTRLEPTHDAMGLPPVDGVPVHRRVGGRTSHRVCGRRRVGRHLRASLVG